MANAPMRITADTYCHFGTQLQNSTGGDAQQQWKYMYDIWSAPLFAQYNNTVCPFQSLLFWWSVRPDSCRLWRLHHAKVHPAMSVSSPRISVADDQPHYRLHLCLQWRWMSLPFLLCHVVPLIGLSHVFTLWLAAVSMVLGFLSSSDDQQQRQGKREITRTGTSF